MLRKAGLHKSGKKNVVSLGHHITRKFVIYAGHLVFSVVKSRRL